MMFATKKHNPNESHSTPHVHHENTSHVYAWVDNHDDQTLFVESVLKYASGSCLAMQLP